MKLRPEEITSILKERIENAKKGIFDDEEGEEEED